MNINQTIEQKESNAMETPHKAAGTAAVSIAGCACVTFFLAAFFGAAWPGAVVACALCFMGVGVAYFIMRRA